MTFRILSSRMSRLISSMNVLVSSSVQPKVFVKMAIVKPSMPRNKIGVSARLIDPRGRSGHLITLETSHTITYQTLLKALFEHRAYSLYHLKTRCPICGV